MHALSNCNMIIRLSCMAAVIWNTFTSTRTRPEGWTGQVVCQRCVFMCVCVLDIFCIFGFWCLVSEGSKVPFRPAEICKHSFSINAAMFWNCYSTSIIILKTHPCSNCSITKTHGNYIGQPIASTKHRITFRMARTMLTCCDFAKPPRLQSAHGVMARNAQPPGTQSLSPNKSHFHVKWSFQIKLVFSCGGAGRAKKNKHNLLSNIQTYRETGALNRCFALSWPSVARVTLERNACHDQQW